MNTLNFIIPGKPAAKQRARKGQAGNWYNPSKKDMQIIKNYIEKQLPIDFKMIKKEIPVAANIIFFFLPNKTELKKKSSSEIENEKKPYLKKGDIDNLCKTILDCGNKLLWHDDNQVYYIRISKYYSIKPRTELEIIW